MNNNFLLSNFKFPFQGLLYNNALIYNLHTFLKLKFDFSRRFQIAGQYIEEGESVLDVCAGPAALKAFLPKNCRIHCVDVSDAFVLGGLKKGQAYERMDLREGITLERKFDALVMVISLCQFREVSEALLLEQFKTIAKKIIIVEEVLPDGKDQKSWIKAARGHLCLSDYCPAFTLFTRGEFQSLMRRHGYENYSYNKRYSVGYFKRA